MFTDYVLIAAITTTAALIWRALLLEHAPLLARVEALPFIGGALRCGFCMSVWLSLFAVAIQNPIEAWTNSFHPFIALLCAWFALAAGVLFLRNLIAALIEGTGVLTHMHRSEVKH